MEQIAGILVENLKCPSHGGPMGIICRIAMISNIQYSNTWDIQFLCSNIHRVQGS